ncbi:MAG: YggS family pyridoxal phosphate-dependent enzyme [Lachnospiraceae bacterium]|nr:YggS family pyridoxal phosphate-dependent enzyme [Lachnospiraceae bacterium]
MSNNLTISDNLKNVYGKIDAAKQRSEISAKNVKLIAVSKTKPVSMIEECIKEGTVVFGENKAQEMSKKISEINNPNLEWHFIGHLQRNKVKYVVGNASLIHSVDSVRLAVAINEESIKKNVISDILIQVNVADEDTKFGVKVDELIELINEIYDFSNIRIRGLMTSAPYVTNPEENRIHFAKLRNLLVDINSKNIDNICMDILSMGMTGDYEVAIEEGATMVRVGTGIFGDRIYM